MSALSAPILSDRLSLVVMTPNLLATMSGDLDEARPFVWPSWWPDEPDRRHLAMWSHRAAEAELNIAWGPRAVVDVHGRMLGHAGFHSPPAPIETGLAEPTFVGRRDPVAGGVVELGYTIFPIYRHRGFATEAVRALVSWAEGTGEVGALLATVATGNTSSVRVLERVGGFAEIGSCVSENGELEVVYRRDHRCGAVDPAVEDTQRLGYGMMFPDTQVPRRSVPAQAGVPAPTTGNMCAPPIIGRRQR
jgi:[ribosomal protein S5]-alanine N-acetyltransferase